MSARRILLASYHFPPSAAVGGLRLARFARLLPAHGWEVFVLTVRDEDRGPDEGFDTRRLEGLESTHIVKTRAPQGLIALYGQFRAWLRRGTNGRSRGTGSQGASTDPAVAPRERFTAKLKRYVVSLVLLLPDEQKNWSLFAAVVAVRLIRQRRIECVLTSGPPFSGHVIGLAAKLFTNAIWVADFRDPWVEMLPERWAHSRSKLSDRLERWMEASVMHGADKVLTTTDRMRDAIAARHPSLAPRKFVCLPNGVDASPLPGSSAEKYEPFTITYAGTIYFDRTPEPLFKAFAALVQEGRVRPEEFRIKLVGSCRQINGVDTRVVAQRYGLERSVEIVDAVPHAEAVDIMRRSHLLLVLAPEHHRLVLPAKVFDYLGSGSQILALAEAGATADLLEETGCGACFSQHDVPGLRDYLGGLLEDGRYRHLRNEPESFARYDARRLTERLARELSHDPVEPRRVPVGV